MSEIKVLDTTLRDGEQAPGNQLKPNEKLIIARELENIGIDIIDAGFPASSQQEWQAVKNISEFIKVPTICVLTRTNEKDIDVAYDSIKLAKNKRIQTGISTSDIHLKSKLNITKEQALNMATKAVKYAKKYVEDVQFYAEDAGRSENDFLAQMIEKVIVAGATVVNIPDTTGYCLPFEYGEKVRYVLENVKGIQNVTLSTHCHNDLGLATANTLCGIINGARQIEVTINGVGERAGNAPLEEIVTILHEKFRDKYQTNIKLRKLFNLSALVSKLMNHPMARNKTITGENSFSHTSGIHQDGIIKNALNYEILSPSEVGQEKSKIILSSKSGRAALFYSYEKLGYHLDKENLDIVYNKFLSISKKKSIIDENDLIEIITTI